MNVLTIAGYLGSDAETRFSKAGTAMTSFSVPAESGWGDNKKTTWVRCTLFGRKGANEPHGLADYLVKSRYVVVTGELEAREWEGNKGTMFSVEMTVRDVALGPMSEKSQSGVSSPTGEKSDYQPSKAAQSAEEDVGRFADTGDIDDDVPF